MATRYIFLPKQAELATSNPPQLTTINDRPVLAFDASTDETCYWTAVAPENLIGPLGCTVFYVMASATSGAVAWQIYLEAITSNDSIDLDATTYFDSANNGGDSVASTAGYMHAQATTINNGAGMVAGDLIRIKFNRDADSGSDTATGDFLLLALELKDGT
jgi:hypothetical protein